MKVTIQRIVATRREVEQLESLTPSPPMSLAVKIARNVRLVGYVYDDYEKVRVRLIQEYGSPSPNGGWEIDPNDREAMEKFAAENVEALGQEVEVDVYPITTDELESAAEKKEGFSIPVALLSRLDYLFQL